MIQMTDAYNEDIWATHFVDSATSWHALYTSPHKNALVDHIEPYIEKKHFGYDVKRLFFRSGSNAWESLPGASQEAKDSNQALSGSNT